MIAKGPTSRLRPLIVAGLAVALASVAALACNGDEPPPPDTVLPDLTMSPPDSLRIARSVGGEEELRFDTVMNNLGAGNFVVRARRAGDQWTLDQEITLAEGGTMTAPIPAGMEFGGDGHGHWHIIGAARYRLQRLDGELEGDRFDHKVGFCMFDSVPQNLALRGAPDRITFVEPGCGRSESQELRMGISIGWGDIYPSSIDGQYIDIAGLPEGAYRLLLEVDPLGLFQEADRTNNTAWADFVLGPPTPPHGLPLLLVTGVGTSYITK